MSVLIVDDDSKCNQIIDRAPRCLKKIISIREVRMATMQRARSRAIEIIRFDEIERAGAQKMFEEVVSLILYKLCSARLWNALPEKLQDNFVVPTLINKDTMKSYTCLSSVHCNSYNPN